MPSKANSHGKKVEDKLKALRAEFSDYENAVTMISSFEAWVEHEWGTEGKQGSHLVRFDRFPVLDGNLTPDFLAEFDTPYVICGEHKKNYHPASDDRDQVISYSNWQPKGSPPPAHDVLLLVGTHCDNVAADDIYGEKKKPEPLANVVIVGFFRDSERVNGEWFDLKWRDHGGKNRMFSKPNVTNNRAEDDLNALLADQSHCSIQVVKPAIDLSGRNPLINDEPPPLYTVIRIILPAINELLTEADRDMLASARRVEKTLLRSDLLSTDITRSLKRREKTVQKALDFLVKIGQARKVRATDPSQYVLALDLKVLRSDPLELLSRKAAIALVPRGVEPKGRRGKVRDVKGQRKLFE